MTSYSLSGKTVYVAGHRGMVGSALMRRLQCERPARIVTADRSECDLRDPTAVRALFDRERPNSVFVPAAKVGGILANRNYPADYLYDNLMIAGNIIHAAHAFDVEKLLFLGSSCIYPKHADQPLTEDSLLTGPLEPTNEWYAVAKIAGVKLCQAYRRQHGRNFISAMPTNLYGPGDNYDPESSHVAAALIRKAHEAKVSGASSMELWGTGQPRREFLHVDDAADALVLLMKHYDAPEPINVGCGSDLTIRELAETIAEVVGFAGGLAFDTSKPDGTPRKLMDVSRLNALGWRARTPLREGLEHAYTDFIERL